MHLIFSTLLFLLAFPVLAQERIVVALPIASDIEAPTALDNAGDGSGRVFIVQRSGRVLVWQGGDLSATPFLDISDRVSCCGERGLLGIAFHPEFASNGEFFVNYTDSGFDTVVSRFTAGAGSDVADAGSEEIVLSIEQPFSNHNGGQLAFGPDGFLYIGLGDGGGGGDPQNNSQDPLSLLGKMLRIDVDNAVPYSIPASNPFASDDFTLDEIWALGLRNPFRYSFDRITGDLYIADVGQDAIEEVHVHRANTASGENYGWRLMEGSQCFNPGSGCNDGSLTLPAFEYRHQGGRCSITGGYVYRGAAIPALQGHYLYGDFCTGEIFSAMETSNGWQQQVLLDTAFDISSFGETEAGEILVADLGGRIYQLVEPLVISPGTGIYLQSQQIDLTLALRHEGSPVASISLKANGVDVSDLFEQCAVTGTLTETVSEPGQSFRCPGITLDVLEPGETVLQAELILLDGTVLRSTAVWQILAVNEL